MAGYAIGSFVESLLASRIGLKNTGLLAAILLLVLAAPYLPQSQTKRGQQKKPAVFEVPVGRYNLINPT